MGGMLLQIAVIDIVFSLDSVITAVGMASEVAIMIAAIMLSAPRTVRSTADSPSSCW